MNHRHRTLLFIFISALLSHKAFAADHVAGRLIVFNDNGAWCWFQGERAVIDQASSTLLFSSVADSEGVDGAARTGDVDLVSYPFETGIPQRFVLHHNLQKEDDHNSAGLLIRPDGKYLAMYTRHNQSAISYWRVSTNPHDATQWDEEKTFDWSSHLSPDGSDHVTYSNLFYLSNDHLAYDFTRGVNLDPSILVSNDEGDTWSYGGKLLTLPKLGYVNGYTKYASNNIDRIDFVTTDHHPRDFNNNIYHGYVQAGKLHGSDGVVIDDQILDDKGHPNTELTRVFPANSVFDGETMSHAWIVDIRLDQSGHPCAILSARANDIPDNTNFNDHRFFYARFDGSKWNVFQLAKAGARLWESEQDYTGLAALNPNDCNTVYISTTFDPGSGKELKVHEIYKGVTSDAGKTWAWTPLTEDSSVDNLRPVIPPWTNGNTAVLWFRGSMRRSQRYDCAMVGILDRPSEKLGETQSVKIDSTNTRRLEGTARPPTTPAASTAPLPQRALWKTQIAAPSSGRYDVSILFRGDPNEDHRIQAGLSEKSLLWFGPLSTQQVDETHKYRANLGRVDLQKGQAVDVILNDAIDPASSPGTAESIAFTEVTVDGKR